MSVARNKETAQSLFSALRANNIEAAAACVTNDFVTHAQGIPADWPKGPQGVRQRLQANREDTPKSSFEILSLFGEADRLAVHMKWTAPADGDDPKATIGGTNIEIWRFEEGLLAEAWVCKDS